MKRALTAIAGHADEPFSIDQDESGGVMTYSTARYDLGTIKSGSITFDNATKKLTIAAGTALEVELGDQMITLTMPEEITATYKVDDAINYYTLDGAPTARVEIPRGAETITGALKLSGVLSYRPETGTFGLTGGNSSHGNGENTSAAIEFGDGYGMRISTNDTTIAFIPTMDEGVFKCAFPNARKHELRLTLSRDGEAFFDNGLIADGVVDFDLTTHQLSLESGTTAAFTMGDGATIELTATANGGACGITEDGMKINSDGVFSTTFTLTTGAKTTLANVNGALTYSAGKIYLEPASTLTADWELPDGRTFGFKVASEGAGAYLELLGDGFNYVAGTEPLKVT